MNSVCIKEFSWAARWSVGVGYLPGRTWKAFYSVNRIVVKQQVGKHGKVVIKQCWDSELLTFICFSTLQQLMERPKLSKKIKSTCIIALLLSLFKVLGHPKTGWNYSLRQGLHHMGFHKWALEGSWTPANICGIWCIIMWIHSLLFGQCVKVVHLILDF